MNKLVNVLKSNFYIFFVLIISFIGFNIILFNLPNLSDIFNFETFLFLTLSIVASNSLITFKSGLKMTLNAPITIFLLLTLNMNQTLFIGSLGVFSFVIFHYQKKSKIFFNLSQYAISIYLSGTFLYHHYDGNMTLPEDFIYIIPAILIFEITNRILISISVSARSGRPIKQIFITGIKETQVGIPLYLANGLIMNICYRAYSFWGVAIVIIPLFSVNWLLQVSNKADQHKEDSHICPLTTLKNRRCLDEWQNQQFSEIILKNHNFSFAMIDIDNFKPINDHYGHKIGDQVLEELGSLFKEIVKETELIYRYGGEEFLIFFPSLQLEEANNVIERLHNAVRQHSFTDNQITITFSTGIASLDTELLNDNNANIGNEMIRRADMAMYDAKKSGKNQTKFYEC
ncbi:MAG: GGDEF domain-containing protein [Halanaerobiales bacterium]|nr:GGDEF domain-containing protein [Halanaerobiales bacterium]